MNALPSPDNLASWLYAYGSLTVFLQNTPEQVLKGDLHLIGDKPHDELTLDDFMIKCKGSLVTLMAFLDIFVDTYPEVVSQMRGFKHYRDIPPRWIQVFSPGFPSLYSLMPDLVPELNENTRLQYTFKVSPPHVDQMPELRHIASANLTYNKRICVYWKARTAEVMIEMTHGYTIRWFQQSDAPIRDSLAAILGTEPALLCFNCTWVLEPCTYSYSKWHKMTPSARSKVFEGLWSSLIDYRINLSFGVNNTTCCCKSEIHDE